MFSNIGKKTERTRWRNGKKYTYRSVVWPRVGGGSQSIEIHAVTVGFAREFPRLFNNALYATIHITRR